MQHCTPPELRGACHVKLQWCDCAAWTPQGLGAVLSTIRTVLSDATQAPPKMPPRQRGCSAHRVNSHAGLGLDQFPHTGINTPNLIQEKGEGGEKSIDHSTDLLVGGASSGDPDEGHFCRKTRPSHEDELPTTSEKERRSTTYIAPGSTHQGTLISTPL